MEILIVEDVRFSSLLLENQLSQYGHKSYSVSCGYDALDFLDSPQSVDIVICDLNLPDMTALRVFQECQQLKKFKNRPLGPPPFILYTASKNVQELRKAEAMGFIGALTKPLNMQLLNEMLSTIDDGNLLLRNNQGKAKILVVGTSGKNADLLQDIFNGTGYTLLMAPDRHSCIEYLKEYRSICMVVCDLEFDNTNAMSVLKDIREDQKSLPDGKLPPFVLMTESQNMDLVQLAHLSGFSEIISAPLEKQTVKQKLNQLLMRDPSYLIQPSILVIDDIGFHCVLTKAVFSRLVQIREQQYNILSASTAGEALNILKSDRSIQLVVTDYYLPDLNGIQMFRDFKALLEQNHHLFGSDYQIPDFFLLTISPNEEVFSEGMNAGFKQVFRKPLDPTMFLPAVCNSLGFSLPESGRIKNKTKPLNSSTVNHDNTTLT